jgi:hypothetical protein
MLYFGCLAFRSCWREYASSSSHPTASSRTSMACWRNTAQPAWPGMILEQGEEQLDLSVLPLPVERTTCGSVFCRSYRTVAPGRTTIADTFVFPSRRRRGGQDEAACPFQRLGIVQASSRPGEGQDRQRRPGRHTRDDRCRCERNSPSRKANALSPSSANRSRSASSCSRALREGRCSSLTCF